MGKEVNILQRQLLNLTFPMDVLKCMLIDIPPARAFTALLHQDCCFTALKEMER